MGRDELPARGGFDRNKLKQAVPTILTAWTEFSAKARMVSMLSLFLVVVVCIVLVTNSSSGNNPRPDPHHRYRERSAKTCRGSMMRCHHDLQEGVLCAGPSIGYRRSVSLQRRRSVQPPHPNCAPPCNT